MARTAGKSHGTQSHAPPAAQLPGISRIIQPSPHSPLCPRTKAHPLGSRTDGAPTLSPIGSNDGPETSALHPLPTLRTDKDNDKDKDKDNDNIQDSRRRKARDTRHVTKRNHLPDTQSNLNSCELFAPRNRQSVAPPCSTILTTKQPYAKQPMLL